MTRVVDHRLSAEIVDFVDQHYRGPGTEIRVFAPRWWVAHFDFCLGNRRYKLFLCDDENVINVYVDDDGLFIFAKTFDVYKPVLEAMADDYFLRR